MSITSIGLSSLEKATMPTTSRFPSPTLPPLNTRFPPIDTRLIAATRLPGLAMYGSPYTTPNFPSYFSYNPAAAAVAAAATDPSAFYPPMVHGDNVETWRASLGQAAAAYYDPTMAAHYGYSYGPMGLGDGARRKNATRETTSTLKAWLNDHRKNPYPTKGEKIMLAIITKMTLTQVSTWFANARRRLKKENKMTWSPRNRCGEDDEDDDMDEGPHHGDNANSRLPSPLSPEMPSNGLVSAHSIDRQCNGLSNGIDSYSDEGAHFGETRKESATLKPNNKASIADKSKEEYSSNLGSNQTSFEDFKAKLPLSLNPRQQNNLFENSSSPSLSNASKPSLTRQNIPFPHPLPQLPLAPPPHHNILHPGISEHLNHSSTLNRLPPHIMAALFEQAQQYHYQQALHGLPVNSLMSTSTSENFKLSSALNATRTKTTVSPTASRRASSSSPTVTKPSSVSSPTKCKIWSLADVATNNDTGKNPSKSNINDEIVITDTTKHDQNDIPNARMWMDILQQRISAGMSNNPNHHQLNHLPAALHHSSGMITQGRFPPFSTFPGLFGVPENNKIALKELERNSQDLSERSSFSPLSHSSDVKDNSTSENPLNNQSRSPRNSHHGDSSHDASDGK